MPWGRPLGQSRLDLRSRSRGQFWPLVTTSCPTSSEPQRVPPPRRGLRFPAVPLSLPPCPHPPLPTGFPALSPPLPQRCLSPSVGQHATISEKREGSSWHPVPTPPGLPGACSLFPRVGSALGSASCGVPRGGGRGAL